MPVLEAQRRKRLRRAVRRDALAANRAQAWPQPCAGQAPRNYWWVAEKAIKRELSLRDGYVRRRMLRLKRSAL